MISNRRAIDLDREGVRVGHDIFVSVEHSDIETDCIACFATFTVKFVAVVILFTNDDFLRFDIEVLTTNYILFL